MATDTLPTAVPFAVNELVLLDWGGQYTWATVASIRPSPMFPGVYIVEVDAMRGGTVGGPLHDSTVVANPSHAIRLEKPTGHEPGHAGAVAWLAERLADTDDGDRWDGLS